MVELRPKSLEPDGGTVMNNDGIWIAGFVMGLLSLLGLVLASAAHDSIFYAFGLTLFLFGVLFIFGLIGKYVGHGDQQ